MDYSILIPLGSTSHWDDNELKYMLRSIDKHFKFDYDITIYSDHDIDWIKNVNVKRIPRYYPPNLMKRLGWDAPHYEQFYDTLNKLRLLSSDDELNDNILYVYDDVLLLKDQDAEQIKTLYCGGRYRDNEEYWNNPGKNKWKNTILQAIDRIRGFGEVYLYETHLPRYYQKSKLKDMFKTFPIEQLDIPYAPATLYFNMFYDKPDVMFPDSKIKSDNDIKAGFYASGYNLCDSFLSKTMVDIENATNGKLWVNYSDSGLTEELKKWIQKRFNKKSRFEK